VAGSFEFLREDMPDGTVRLPYGLDKGTEPDPMLVPGFPLLAPPSPTPPGPPNPPAAGNATNAAPQHDPTAMINSAMDAMRAMTQAMVQTLRLMRAVQPWSASRWIYKQPL